MTQTQGQTRRLNIVMLHTDFRLYWGARLAAMNESMGSAGHKLTVIELAGKGSPYSFAGREGVGNRLVLFPDRAIEELTPTEASSAIKEALDRIQPDVVIAGAIAFYSGAGAVRWARCNGKRVVIFDNARLKDVPRGGVVNWVKGRLYRNVDAMILPAPSHGEDYERWGTPRDRMFFGLNCVDNAFFADRCDRWRNESESTRREMNLPDRFLLGVGRMIEKKNWHALLKAWEARMSEVTSRGCDLVLVGDGPERGRLEEVVRSSGIRNVHFRGFEDQEGLCRYYALASGLVLPSRHGETWGLVVNEAMAAGLPILVSRECGCAQTLVEDGVNGWTFNPADVAGIGEALGKWMACTGEHLRTMGACSQRQIGAWDVTRFAREATRAAVHVAGIPARRGSYLDRVLINTWKGRYRPT